MFRVAHRSVGKDFKPFIILGYLQIMEILNMPANNSLAKNAGADAIKYKHTPDTMTINCDKDDF